MIIGHRGTGKTSLIHRIHGYYQEISESVLTFDLDQEIENRQGRSIAGIFSEDGERVFREIETQTLNTLSSEVSEALQDVFVAAGAGFSGSVPEGWTTLWITRDSDSIGRTFVDRPRLNPELDPIEEYLQRYRTRDRAFQERADQILTLPEGFDFSNEPEKKFFLEQIKDIEGAITLFPSVSNKKFSKKIETYTKMGVRYIELRDDLLSGNEFNQCEIIQTKTILLSFRKKERLSETIQWMKKCRIQNIDWANELGECPAEILPTILSFHYRGEKEPINQALERIESSMQKGVLLKVAIPINDFFELKQGYEWWKKNPKQRIFLPSSDNGRWSWFRLRMKFEMELNFFREDRGSSLDQPLLLEWIRNESNKKFAAILGDPVGHSRTPGEHYSFFRSQKMNIHRIQISDVEFSQGGLEFLKELGLQAAAVTSPLKETAFLLSKNKTSEAEKLKSVNTLWNTQSGWCGANTDLYGLSKMLENFEINRGINLRSLQIVIWGGSGVLTTVHAILPRAIAFSARSGQVKKNKNEEIKKDNAFEKASPDMVIWSIGRKNWLQAESIFPPSHWRPKWIIDLNYAEDSPGREYAQMLGARYESGLMMFRYQAEGQRQFWNQFLNES